MDSNRIDVGSKRNEINAIDSELLELLNRRAEIALWVGAMKAEKDASLCDLGREREVLDRLCRENVGPLDEQGVRNIFQRIIDESLYLQQQAYQKKIGQTTGPVATVGPDHRVAILGERGTFSEEAAIALLGDKCKTISRPSFEALFHAMERDEVEHILVPIENSLVGPLHRCIDLLIHSSLNITAEIFLPVSQFLIGCEGATMETIKSVESHPTALGQCEGFFAANPQLARSESADTAGSVRRVVESGDVSRSAIGSRRAAEIYGGKIIRENIEDHSDNWTRFVLLSNHDEEPENGAKISLVLKLNHRPGSLHSALRPIVRRGINLLKIESRPLMGDPTQFSFYLELEMPAVESEFENALSEISEHAKEIKLLGRYSTLDIAREGR
jgi:prephenate dehydratase/chorismate mutase